MSAFNNMLKHCKDHNFGGTSSVISCEPYLSGYGFTKWYLPETLNPYLSSFVVDPTNDQTISAKNVDDAALFLSSACISVTPPTETLTTTEFDGSCGVKFANPGRLEYGYSLSAKYLEMSGLPIYRIHQIWLEMIRENKTGLETGSLKTNDNDRRDNYAGRVLYWTTKPDGLTVEFAAYYSGVYPTKATQDNFNFDVTSIDKVETDYEYHIDFIWNQKWVYEMAKNTAKSLPYAGISGTRHFSNGFRMQNTIGTTSGWSRDSQSEKM